MDIDVMHPKSGRSIKEDNNNVNTANRLEESLGTSGKRIVAAATAAPTPSENKEYGMIEFPLGGSFTAVQDDDILSGALTGVTLPAGYIYYGRVQSYTADAVTFARERDKRG